MYIKVYYSAMRKEDIVLFVTTWMGLEAHYVKWDKPDKIKTSTVGYQLPMESKKVEPIKEE